MDDPRFTTKDDARAVLLHGLYVNGVFDFEETRRWASELGLDDLACQRLLNRCVQAHFAAPDELAAR
jgi:hypothetical protein